MRKPLSTETLIGMLPLIGWEYFKSPNRLNDKLITNNGNVIKLRVEKDRFEFSDMHTKEADYYNASYRLSFDEHEIEYNKKGKFISIIPKGSKNPATFMLLSGK